MNNIKKISTLFILSIIVLFVGALSCVQGVPQQEYNSVKYELMKTESQLTTLQNELAEAERMGAEAERMKVQYEELNKQSEALKTQNEVNIGEMKTIETKYEELSREFEALKRENDANLRKITANEVLYAALREQYDAVRDQPFDITEENIEQNLFELINQDRKENGIDELIWGINLHGWAVANSQEMARESKYQYSSWASWQEVFWAIGYNRLEEITNSALTMWKTNTFRYENNIINEKIPYGAVGAYKSGDIYYITYMGSPWR